MSDQVKAHGSHRATSVRVNGVAKDSILLAVLGHDLLGVWISEGPRIRKESGCLRTSEGRGDEWV